MRKVTISVQHCLSDKPVVTEERLLYGLDVLKVAISEGEITGYGEATGVWYLDETAETMLAYARAVKLILENDVCNDRMQLLRLLPPGGTRNAIDCALWDLEAKKAGVSLAEYSGIPPKMFSPIEQVSLQTSPCTLMLKAKLVKLSLRSFDNPIPWLTEFNRHNSGTKIIVDANQHWQFKQLQAYAPLMRELGVVVIEQPLAPALDSALEGYQCPVILCADESCHDRNDLPSVARHYQMIKIKLDKAGGLTEALALANAARQLDLKLMVGNMLGTQLAMQPALVLARLAELVDWQRPQLTPSREGAEAFPDMSVCPLRESEKRCSLR
ncbi:MAG: dipeptide epimerase [Alteromonadaceae bacterium]|nr:dipeptide epimerase [Alteromonadaceae bacterium]